MAAKIEGSTDGGCFSRQAKGNDAHLEGVDDDWHRSALSRVLSRVVEDLEPPSLVESLRRQRDVIVDELFAALADEGLLKREGPTPGATVHTPYKGFEVSGKLKSITGHADCLVITSTGPVDLQMRAVPKLQAREGSGIQDEVKRIVELIDGDRQKDLPVLGPYRIEGEGRVIPVWVDGLGVRHSKKFYLKLIEDFLVQCKKPAALIWYSGHGQRDTGHWCFKDDVLTFEELLSLYETHFRGRLLTVVTDCCYSGHWAYQLAEALEQKGIPPCGHHAEEAGYLIKLYASCQPHERATMCSYTFEGVSAGSDGLVKFEVQTALKGQRTCGVDTTSIRCSGLDRGIPCGTCVQNVSWRDIPRYQCLSHFVQQVPEGNGWLYLLLFEEEEATFKVKVQKGARGEDVLRHGRVLCSGWDEEPPPEVVRAVTAFFDL